MLRSMYSGVSGMKNLQVKMDVIANNIANVNTIGFKSSRVMFQDIMSQTTTQATAGQPGGLGGTNMQQIGLGVQVGSIDTIHEPGAPTSTGRDLDFYLEGGGYFVVRDGEGNNLYTRDGIFTRDGNGDLVNSSGMKVMGAVSTNNTTAPDITNNSLLAALNVPEEFNGQAYQSMAIDKYGVVSAKYGNQDVIIGRVAVATFNNPDALQKLGGNNYGATVNTGNAILGAAGQNGSGMMQSGKIEMSNVDLSTEFTEMIVASRAYQANSRSITTSDEMLQELLNLKR
ncbi:flagellar hook protein FlgE [Enterococcus sp. DIV2402]|uniref:Flagellar hook protein FlgE n=1 Tax=Candidatus Enterococcus lowellii TaxID=2230877 RepID=A0ABZ2SKA3_9ENTE|nr:flagellar hook-basal body complex protein [Enterococcus sp. DIV2402]MBO0465751.1 flagellar hook-basal body complex protein [Enterococcus sp. DIV2402]